MARNPESSNWRVRHLPFHVYSICSNATCRCLLDLFPRLWMTCWAAFVLLLPGCLSVSLLSDGSVPIETDSHRTTCTIHFCLASSLISRSRFMVSCISASPSHIVIVADHIAYTFRFIFHRHNWILSVTAQGVQSKSVSYEVYYATDQAQIWVFPWSASGQQAVARYFSMASRWGRGMQRVQWCVLRELQNHTLKKYFCIMHLKAIQI